MTKKQKATIQAQEQNAVTLLQAQGFDVDTSRYLAQQAVQQALLDSDYEYKYRCPLGNATLKLDLRNGVSYSLKVVGP